MGPKPQLDCVISDSAVSTVVQNSVGVLVAGHRYHLHKQQLCQHRGARRPTWDNNCAIDSMWNLLLPRGGVAAFQLNNNCLLGIFRFIKKKRGHQHYTSSLCLVKNHKWETPRGTEPSPKCGENFSGWNRKCGHCSTERTKRFNMKSTNIPLKIHFQTYGRTSKRSLVRGLDFSFQFDLT